MIYTGGYKNCLKCNLVSISGDRGKSVNYLGACFPTLAPKLSFLKEWHNNIGKIPEDENNRYYIEQFYKQVLKPLDSNEIVKILIDNTILLCYEDNMEFCHRHIVAYWLEKNLGIEVPEVKVDEFGNITILERPIWIGEILDVIISKEALESDKKLIKTHYESNLDFFRKCTERK